MNKTELINEIAVKAGLSKKDAEKALNATLDVVSDALAAGEKYEGMLDQDGNVPTDEGVG